MGEVAAASSRAHHTTINPNAREDGMMMGEEKEEEDGPSDVELPPVLVTFEGSARGLNFDAVITSSSLAGPRWRHRIFTWRAAWDGPCPQLATTPRVVRKSRSAPAQLFRSVQRAALAPWERWRWHPRERTTQQSTPIVDDLCMKYFVEAGIICTRRCNREDLKRLTKATGGRVVTTMADIEGNETSNAECLGGCDSVRKVCIGDG